MFNSTHTLVGLAVARSGFHRWAPHAVWTAIIASNLPDIDIVTRLAGAPAYVEYHRGITHTLAGVPALSLLLAAVMHQISGNFRKHFLLSMLVMATHPLLDLANTYGIRPLLPFADTWFYGDTLFIIDPYLDLILLAGVLGSYLTSPSRRRLAAQITLVVVAVYFGARVQLREAARTQLAEFSTSVPGQQRSGVSPRMLTPHVFTGIVETSNEILSLNLNILSGGTAELTRMPKARHDEVLVAALRSRAGSAFHGFARFPLARVEQVSSGYRVTLIDFRYYREATQTAFAARIHLDDSLRVVNETIGFNLMVD